MKRAIVVLVLFAFVFAAASAFAGEACSKSSSTGESGWQQAYDSIASWCWSSDKSASKESKGAASAPASADKSTCK
jgi:hypothetical protein